MKERPGGGPLAWLAGFTSLGLDHRTPRPPTPYLRHSRFLGLDARRKGYTIDLDRKYDVHPVPSVPGLPGAGDVLIQRYRGVIKRCFRPEGTKLLLPMVDERPQVDGAQLRRFLAEWPARAVMPKPPRGDQEPDLQWHVTAIDNPEGVRTRPATEAESAQIVREFLEIQQLVRLDFLRLIWLREQHPQESPSADLRLQVMVERIVEYCVHDDRARAVLDGSGQRGKPSSPAGLDLDLSTSDQDVVLLLLANVDAVISKLRSPLFFADSGNWVGIAFPGVIWAEILNAFLHDRASWPLLRCCGYCGRLWIATMARRGRPAEFCGRRCQRRFNDPGSSDYQRKRPC